MIAGVVLRFYVFGDSYPCEAVLAAARHKGLAYERVDVPPVLHAFVMRARFGERTVPGAEFDGRRVHGSSAILRALDEVAPAPPLFPADPERRAEVEAAEAWGAGAFQDIGRRLVWFHFAGRPAQVRRWAERDEHRGTRVAKQVLARPMARIAATANRATADRVRSDLAVLPALLDRIDGLMERGVIGDPGAPNAADFQVLSSVAAWCVLADLRPLLAERPCVRRGLELFPGFASEDMIAGGVFPADWLAPLHARA